ncbi:MAG: DinB family protein [Fimbriimonadia bacterium]|nr:DinB family protein [Fimbriimonadia bacterium]
MSAQEYLAETARRMAKTIERTVAHLPEDKREWVPMGSARTAVDMLAECAFYLNFATLTMKGMATTGEGKDMAALQALPFNELVAELHKNAQAYAETIASLTDEQFVQEVTHPMTGRPTALVNVVNLPAMNLVYHWGQINYMQMMLGDTEMHW